MTFHLVLHLCICVWVWEVIGTNDNIFCLKGNQVMRGVDDAMTITASFMDLLNFQCTNAKNRTKSIYHTESLAFSLAHWLTATKLKFQFKSKSNPIDPIWICFKERIANKIFVLLIAIGNWWWWWSTDDQWKRISFMPFMMLTSRRKNKNIEKLFCSVTMAVVVHNLFSIFSFIAF